MYGLSPMNLTQTISTQPQSINTNLSFQSKKTSHANKSNINFAGKSLKGKDTVSFKSNPQVVMVPDLYPPFQIGLDMIKNNFIKAIDGMIPYGPEAPADLQGFPQGNSYHYAPGFKADLNLNGETTFNKGVQDGGIDPMERTLALNELDYCTNEMYAPGTQENNSCLNAKNLMLSLFAGPMFGPLAGRLKPEFDVNNNGIFDAQDADALAKLDGDATSLSKTDLDMASANFVNQMSTMPVQSIGRPPGM